MGRRVRFLPPEGGLVEVTCRTIQGRHLLRPGRELNKLAVGVLARAQAMYPVQIHAFVVMSNHYHLLLSVKDAQRLSRFMNFFQSNLAREAGRLHDWRDRFWSRRYMPIVVSREERAQFERLSYILSHGVKEGLVRSPRDWPGVHCVKALSDGTPLQGVWVDRTRRSAGEFCNERSDERSFTTTETVFLEPLPCCAHWDAVKYRRHILDLLATITSTYRTDFRSSNARSTRLPLDPHHRPSKIKRKYPPWFHCASRATRRELQEAYAMFLTAYREASELFRKGVLTAPFPHGSFPPPMQFVV